MELDNIFLSDIFDFINSGIIVLDKNFIVTTVNDYVNSNFSDAYSSSFFDGFKSCNCQNKINLKSIITDVFNTGNIYKNLDYIKDDNENCYLISIKRITKKQEPKVVILISENNLLSNHKNKNYDDILLRISKTDSFLNNIDGSFFVLNFDGTIISATPSSTKLTEYNIDELKTFSLYDITPKYQHCSIDKALRETKENGNYTIDIQYIRKDNKTRYWSANFVKISDTELISHHKDINDKMLLLDKLQFQCNHDHITGLYNRRYITKLLYDYEKNPDIYPLSVVVADINGLKIVNDAFGRFAGDSLIKKAASIIENSTSNDDAVAKWDGDEFIIISTKSSLEYVQNLILKIKKECEESVNRINLSMSFGFKIKYNNNVNFDDILKAAENMMLQNKIYEGASFRSQTISIILNTLHEKNKREEQHSVRVSHICMEIGKAMNLSQSDINKLKVIGLLHDIGKIGISETILNKVGKLTDEEFEEIKKHSEIGYRILSSSNQTSELAQDVLDHHERYDGKGYPKGIPGHKLSTMAKTLTVADSYDAMTSVRPYKNAMTKEEAIIELKKYSSKQFDPYIVDIFINKVLNNPVTEI